MWETSEEIQERLANLRKGAATERTLIVAFLQKRPFWTAGEAAAAVEHGEHAPGDGDADDV